MGPIRQRKALSCVDCRRRKVKCDRTVPVCVRCQKSGNADRCTYVAIVGAQDTILTPEDESPEHQREEQPEDLDKLIAPWQRKDGFIRSVVQPQQSEKAKEQAPKTVPTEKELLSRVIELETYVRSAGGRGFSAEMYFGIGNPIGPSYSGGRNPMSDYDKVMVRGQSFSTQYFGPSFPLSLLLQFEELSKFVKSILTIVPDLAQAKTKMATIRDASRRMTALSWPHDLRSLIRMVPSKEVADGFVEHYLETFETTYRILHVPSFRRAYAAFWKNPRESKPEFVAQLLLVIATTYCIVPGGPPGYVGRSSARREVVTRWVTACEDWVGEQSKKHMTMSHLQVHVLIFIARAMCCIKVKREWINTGMLIRLAMGAGMHREPSLLSQKISHFDCEMRRRLWFSIVEIDLQTTIGRGMAPSIDSFGWDALPPRNIHDEEFDENTTAMPSSRPKSEFTRTSFLHCINDFLSLRTEILGRMNSIRLGVDLEKVMQYDNKLRKVIDDLPAWTSLDFRSMNEPYPNDAAGHDIDASTKANTPHTHVTSATSPVSATPATTSRSRASQKQSAKGNPPIEGESSASQPAPSALSSQSTTVSPSFAAPLTRLVLYEFILILHIPFASQTPNASRYLYTTASRRDAAIKCLRIYTLVSPVHRLHLANMRDDGGRACLSMCHDLVTQRTEDPIANVPLAYELILCVVNVLEQRVRDLGQGFHGYWITCTGYSLVQWKLSGIEVPDRFANQAARRVIDLFEGSLLQEQVELPSLNGMVGDSATTGNTSANANANANGRYSRNGSVSGAGVGAGGTAAVGNMPDSTFSPAHTTGQSSVDDVFSGFEDMQDPMWDFMNFDFGSVWNLPTDPNGNTDGVEMGIGPGMATGGFGYF